MLEIMHILCSITSYNCRLKNIDNTWGLSNVADPYGTPARACYHSEPCLTMMGEGGVKTSQSLPSRVVGVGQAPNNGLRPVPSSGLTQREALGGPKKISVKKAELFAQLLIGGIRDFVRNNFKK